MKKLGILLFLMIVGCEVLTIEDISNDVITATAPLNETVLAEGNINFLWEEIEDAEAYKIQIASPSFSEANEIVLDSLTTVLSITTTLEAGNYEWRVKAVNSEYETNYTVNEFTLLESDAID